MQISAFKTRKIEVNDSLEDIIDSYLPPLKEKDIVVLSSKIVSLCEGNVVYKNDTVNKDDLIKNECDYYIDGRNSVPHGIIITLKDGILGASSGIDISNGKNVYILLPKDPFATAHKIRQFLKTKNHLENLGIIIADSHSLPLKYGVLGVGIAWCGFYPLYDYGSAPDIWEASMKGTVVNHLDALAAAAVHEMGEGNEQTPLCVISDNQKIVFNSQKPTAEEIENYKVKFDKDIYYPMFNNSWCKNDRR